MDIRQNPAVIEWPAMPVRPAIDRKVFDQKILEPRGFIIEDILWAIGIWSVLLTMAPVIFIYVLMVA